MVLVQGKKLASIERQLMAERRERELHIQYPWIAALLLILHTKEYNDLKEHREGFLARKLGIAVELESEIVSELLTAGALEWEGKLLVPARSAISTTSDEESSKRIRAYWTSRCLKLLESRFPDQSKNLWGYILLNTSPETIERIRKLYFAFFEDLHNIVAETEGLSDNVHLVNIQFLELSALGAHQPQE